MSHNQTQSNYDWMNIDHCGKRVGKARGLMHGRTSTIHSINIFPEFERRGFAKKTIRMFKKSFDTIIADRVRYTAIGFWKKMDFTPDGNGNYIWTNKRHPNNQTAKSGK